MAMNINERLKKLPLRTYIVSVELSASEACGKYLQAMAKRGWPVLISSTGAEIYHVSKTDLPAPPEGVETKTESNLED